MGTFRRWMVHTTGSWPGPSSWSLAERVPGLTVRAGGAVWQGEGRARADLTATRHPLTQQMEYLGRYIARKLNINYFDCLATSYRHVVRHWPLGTTFSPGIVLRKTGAYGGNPQWDPDV